MASLSGRSALNEINQTIQSLRNEVVHLDAKVNQASNVYTEQQRHRTKIIHDIAAVRLLEIEKGDLQANLTATDKSVERKLEQREQALNELNQQIAQLNKDLEAAEIQREQQLEQVNTISEKIAETEAKVQADLKQDQAYLDQLKKAASARSVAEQAMAKAESSFADMDQKAEPYRQDKLFSYLWDRHYGTPDYKANFFARMMDGWVARVIRYEPSRINFWNLTEIPKRLQQHADIVSSSADEEFMAVQQLEIDALAKAGVPDLEQQLEAAREQIDAQDDKLEELEHELNQSLETRSQFLSGDDNYVKESIQLLSSALENQSLQSIHRYVRETVSPTDDELVRELRSIDDYLPDVKGDLSDLRRMHQQKVDRLKQIEHVRRRFKNARYDDVRSGFSDSSIVSMVLGQFLSGLIQGADVWKTIKRHQRFNRAQSMPDFGSGGLGDIFDISVGSGGSSWHFPSSRGGFGRRSSGGFGRGRSSGGGGFKTGGGI